MATDQMWKFAQGEGWSRIADFVHGDEDDADTSKKLEEAGYPSTSITYGEEYGFQVEVLSAQDPRLPYAYIAWVNIGSQCNMVAVPTLPDLLELLRQLAPMVQPKFTKIASAAPGWYAGSKPVAAWGFTPDGEGLPLVVGEGNLGPGIVPTWDKIQYREP